MNAMRSISQRLLVRCLDILLASIGLVLTAPIIAAAAVILRVHYPYRVFFFQNRVGMDGRLFRILKLVTMVPDAERLPGGGITHDRDPRILPVGRFLRRTKVNELPQLINVLRGDMSIVGPRPVTWSGFQKYDDRSREQLGLMRPGVTGVASIVLFNEEELMSSIDVDRQRYHDQVIKPYKVELEYWYLNNMSVVLYVQVIIATVLTIVRHSPQLRSEWKGLPEPPRELRSNSAFRLQ